MRLSSRSSCLFITFNSWQKSVGTRYKAVRVGGRGEPIEHADALRLDRVEHLAERGVLPPDAADVLVRDVGEIQGVDRRRG